MFPDFDDNLRQAFRRETELFVREHRDGRPQRAGPAARGLHVRQRAAGQALRDSERVRQPLPPRHPRREQRARRAARPRQHPDGDVVRQPHVAGASRQVDPREHRSARRRRRRRRTCRRCRTPTASGEALSMRERMAQHRANAACCELPSADGSGRPVDGELRRHRPMADAHRGGQRRRCVGRAARRHPRSPAWADCARRCCAAGAVRRHSHREADDLRSRPRRRVPRCAGGPRDRPRRAGARLPILVAGPRHRQQRAISDEESQ